MSLQELTLFQVWRSGQLLKLKFSKACKNSELIVSNCEVNMAIGLTFLEIADFAERKIRWLSGGQKSRLVLAAAMWHRPHLICLDE